MGSSFLSTFIFLIVLIQTIHIGQSSTIKGKLRDEEEEDVVLLGEDMRISDKLKQEMRSSEILGNNWKWSEGVVHLNYDQTFSEQEKNTLDEAVTELETKTCIQFFKLPTSPQAQLSYINVTRGPAGSGCWSWTGHQGGEQKINLEDACIHSSIFLHLLVHAIGGFHEFSRTDRDQFVSVNVGNIEDGALHNFEKSGVAQSNAFNLPYDYNSIMEYPSKAYAKDSSIPTIESKEPKVEIPSELPGELTNFDVYKINRLYKGVCKEKRVNSVMAVLFEKSGKLLDEMMRKPYDDLICSRIWMHEGSANLTGCGFTFQTDEYRSTLSVASLPAWSQIECDGKTFLMSVPRPSQSYLVQTPIVTGFDAMEIVAEGFEESYVQVACFGINRVESGPKSLCVNQQLLRKCAQFPSNRIDAPTESDNMIFVKSYTGIDRLKIWNDAFVAFEKLSYSPQNPDLLSNFCDNIRTDKGEGEEEEEEDESKLRSDNDQTCPAMLKECQGQDCTYSVTKQKISGCK